MKKTWTAVNNGLYSSSWNAIPIVQGRAGTGAKVYAPTYNGGAYYSSVSFGIYATQQRR